MIHPKEIEAICRRVISLIEQISNDDRELSKASLSNYIEISRKGVQILLTGFSLKEYRNLLERLLIKNKLNDRASEKYVEDLLRNLMCEQLSHDMSLEETSKSLEEKLEMLNRDCKQHTVYLPLEGFFLYEEEVEELKLGQICIVKLTEPKFQLVFDNLRHIWLENQHHSQREKEYFLKEDEGALREAFLNRVCAKISVKAEAKRAVEIAIEKTQDALNLLKYAIPIIYPRSNHKLHIGIDGEAGFKHTKALALSDPYSSYYLSSSSLLTKTFDINKSVLESLDKIGIFKVSTILEDETNRTEFGEALIEAIRWFSFSQNQLTTAGELLYLTICMEIFLCPKPGDKISTSIAEGVAFILEEELDDRKKIKTRVKHLYGLRSVVAHGKREPVLESDVIEMQEIVMSFLAKMIVFSDELKTLDDLTNWIEDEKLT